MLLLHGRLSSPLLKTPLWGRRSISSAECARLIRRLCDNPELDAQDAKAEFAWLRQSISSNAASTDSPTAENVALKALERLVDRRAEGEPIQYILGDTDFGSLTLLCRPPTLIPRPETAYIFDRLADRLNSIARPTQRRRPFRILDICTGSGCIPLLLAHRLRPHLSTKSWGYDVSSTAVSLAQDNRMRLSTAAQEVSFGLADLFDSGFGQQVERDMGGRVDLVTANPPYISRDEFAQLPKSVSAFEDPRALLGELDDGETRGLAFYHRIAALLPSLLSPVGVEDERLSAEMPRVAVEIGVEQGEAVSAVFEATGLTTEVWDDQYDRPRLVVGFTRPS